MFYPFDPTSEVEEGKRADQEESISGETRSWDERSDTTETDMDALTEAHHHHPPQAPPPPPIALLPAATWGMGRQPPFDPRREAPPLRRFMDLGELGRAAAVLTRLVRATPTDIVEALSAKYGGNPAHLTQVSPSDYRANAPQVSINREQLRSHSSKATKGSSPGLSGLTIKRLMLIPPQRMCALNLGSHAWKSVLKTGIVFLKSISAFRSCSLILNLHW
jgi:hypothetical protein